MRKLIALEARLLAWLAYAALAAAVFLFDRAGLAAPRRPSGPGPRWPETRRALRRAVKTEAAYAAYDRTIRVPFRRYF